VIGNLGDSRAVMGTKDENGNLVPVQLTIDLKPDVPRKILIRILSHHSYMWKRCLRSGYGQAVMMTWV
jgi:hypothetical protein